MHSKDIHKNDNSKNDLYADLQKIKEKASETRDAISQAASDAKGRAHDILEQSLSDMKEKFAGVKEKSADFQENIVTYVQENPVKTIGFAVLAGVLLSQLLRK